MFEIDANKTKEQRTVSRTYRIPVHLIKSLEWLKNESGISQTQIIVQMIEYCLKDGMPLIKK